ncbi:MAG: nucleotidyltransferase domain-containing protein [Lachnospiraceae bacterium]|nr:nucleotidyltransferase domain-containing protein [Lachnospiraceae bacterium]
MNIETIRNIILSVVDEFSIKSVLLFGSFANGNNSENSDVDLIIEFKTQVTLLTLSALKIRLEELMNLDVDIIHGPIQDSDFIKIDRTVELYAA